MSGTYGRFTCTLCWNEGTYNETLLGFYGLCTSHWKEWSITGTYREYTPTGTYYLPEWLRGIISFHHNDERRMYHQEVTFTDVLERDEPANDLGWGGSAGSPNNRNVFPLRS